MTNLNPQISFGLMRGELAISAQSKHNKAIKPVRFRSLSRAKSGAPPSLIRYMFLPNEIFECKLRVYQ